jgi:hypothetical protein
VRRLVVAGVLGGHLHAVLRVVHQGRDAVACGAVVLKTSRASSSRLRQTTSSRQSPNRSADSTGLDLVPLFEAAPKRAPSSRGRGAAFRIPFLDAGAVERFAQQVAVPPEAEVDRARALGRDLHAAGAHQAADVGPAFLAGEGGVDVHAGAAPDVGLPPASMLHRMRPVAASCISAPRPVAGRRLVHHEDLQAGPAGSSLPTCRASPWHRPVLYSSLPSLPMVAAP